MQSELSENPSRPQRGLQYRDLDIGSGVQHMQLYGIRYYMAFSDAAVAAASEHDDLTVVATSGPWVVFEVAESPLVEGLRFEPAVVDGLGHGQDDWLEPVEDWWLQRSQGVTFGADGPPQWPVVELTEDGLVPELPVEELPPVEVTDIETGDDWIRFEVDQVGVPVLVKVSYFPNWRVSGADGPWRVAPNHMVVVPEQPSVRLSYGTSGLDLFSVGLTLVGAVALFVLYRRRRRVRVEPPVAATATPSEPDPDFWTAAPDPLGPDFSSRAFYGRPVDDDMPPDPFLDDGEGGGPDGGGDGGPPDPRPDR
jgi:hypothetical protein